MRLHLTIDTKDPSYDLGAQDIIEGATVESSEKMTGCAPVVFLVIGWSLGSTAYVGTGVLDDSLSGQPFIANFAFMPQTRQTSSGTYSAGD